MYTLVEHVSSLNSSNEIDPTALLGMPLSVAVSEIEPAGRIASLASVTILLFELVNSVTSNVVPALAAGASGAILAIALFAGGLVREMMDAYQAGDVDGATAIQSRLTPLATEIGAAMGPAGLKAALDLVGLHGGAPRSPLLAVGLDERAVVKARLETAGVLPA